MVQPERTHQLAPHAAPPLPPPVARTNDGRWHSSASLEDYQTVADTVGLVPSLRMKDNVFQAIFIAAFTFVAVIVGSALWGFVGGLFSLVGGLFVSLILSGIALMVLGWVRTAKRLKSRQR